MYPTARHCKSRLYLLVDTHHMIDDHCLLTSARSSPLHLFRVSHFSFFVPFGSQLTMSIYFGIRICYVLNSTRDSNGLCPHSDLVESGIDGGLPRSESWTRNPTLIFHSKGSPLEVVRYQRNYPGKVFYLLPFSLKMAVGHITVTRWNIPSSKFRVKYLRIH
jgi:hypothetical protein